jgi:hypothetical protein
MSTIKTQVPTTSQIVTIIGGSNFVPPATQYNSYDSMSYTVPANAATILPTIEVSASPAEGSPSRPLSAAAIRIVNSVLTARVPESAIERD